jgi:nucleoside-diphosphate-sugar epimerase
MSRVFDRADGKEFDYVFNLGGETRYSHDDEVYRARSHTLSLTIGREAAKRKVKVFIEASTGMVYKPNKQNKCKETDKTKPWIKKAKWKLQAEDDLAKIDGLNLAVIRLAHVYGPYTSKLVGTALCMARVYQSLNKEMKWLWDRELRTNTVHVEDVARSLWTVAEWYVREPRKVPQIFNIVDDGDTCKSRISLLPCTVKS